MAERRPLDQQKPAGAAEVLLCTQDGRLLEGLVTNLFVVTAGDSSGGDSGCDSSGSGSPAVTVWTAGMGDGVVWGTARERVLQACRRLGLAVREEAPGIAGRAAWREAFLTNSLRLVQPLSSIACGAGNVWGHEPWGLALPAAPGPTTAAVRAALLELLPAVDAASLAAPAHAD